MRQQLPGAQAQPAEPFDWDRAIAGLKRIFDDLDKRYGRRP